MLLANVVTLFGILKPYEWRTIYLKLFEGMPWKFVVVYSSLVDLFVTLTPTPQGSAPQAAHVKWYWYEPSCPNTNQGIGTDTLGEKYVRGVDSFVDLWTHENVDKLG